MDIVKIIIRFIGFELRGQNGSTEISSNPPKRGSSPSFSRKIKPTVLPVSSLPSPRFFQQKFSLC